MLHQRLDPPQASDRPEQRSPRKSTRSTSHRERQRGTPPTGLSDELTVILEPCPTCSLTATGGPTPSRTAWPTSPVRPAGTSSCPQNSAGPDAPTTTSTTPQMPPCSTNESSSTPCAPKT